MTPDAQAFADGWIAAWNERDLDRILSHYSEDVEFLSPNALKRVGTGRVAGVGALRAYWGPALADQPNLRFELLEVLAGYESLTILYRNHLGGESAESFEFGSDGKVVRSMACHGEVPARARLLE